MVHPLKLSAFLALATLANAAPMISQGPSATTIEAGDHSILSVSATGGTLSYQWYRGTSGDTSSPVSGATGPLLVSQPLQTSASFWVRVTDESGTSDSAAAAASVTEPLSGTLKGMGSNSNGQLGGPLTSKRIIPRPIASDVVRMWTNGSSNTSSSGFSLFLKSDSSLWATGENQYGQLADGDDVSRPDPVQAMTGVTQAALGSYHSVILKADGWAWTAGQNYDGQLGLGTNVDDSLPQAIMSEVAQVAAGSYHSHFLKRDGSLWGAGQNSQGQLGDGSSAPRRAPVQIASGVSKVSGGGLHTLFLKADGSLWAMGYNYYGQLGDGSRTARYTPVMISSGVTDCEAGFEHSIFRKVDGSWWAMGNNSDGALGDGSAFSYRTTPVSIGNDIRRAAAGNAISLWLKNDGSVWAAGNNDSGEFGDGTTTSTAYGEPAGPTLNRAIRIASGRDSSLLIDASPQISTELLDVAILPGATATLSMVATGPGAISYQWYLGESGDTSTPVGTGASFITPALTTDTSYWVRITSAHGTTDSRTMQVHLATTPVIQTGPSAATIPAGEGTALSVTATGGALAYQWYAGPAGNTSAPVPGATGAMLVVPPLFESRSFWVRANNLAGSADSPAVTVTVEAATPAVLRGMGSNVNRQLGTGDTNDRKYPDLAGVATISFDAGRNYSLFIKPDHSLWGMGNLFGNPVQLDTGVIRAAGGRSHYLFLKQDFSLWGARDNSDGELGDGTTVNRTDPIQITSGVARIAGGESFTLFVKTDGSMWACGSNSTGEFGNGTYEGSLIPLFIMDGAVDVAVGRSHTHFLKGDGTLWASGWNSDSQLGDGSSLEFQPSAVQIASGVKRISAGEDHTLFLKSDGSLWTTGITSVGDLPRQIASSGVTRMAAGGDHSLFLKSDGTLWGLGNNSYGELGDGGSASPILDPILIATGVLDVSAGDNHSLFSDRKPAITSQPASILIASGSHTQLSVAAAGEGPLGYQWFQGESGNTSQPLAGETGTTYNTSAITSEARYWVQVTNPHGTWNSYTAVVTPVMTPVITTQPASQNALNGANAALTVAANSLGLTYQWYAGQPGDTSTPVSGATGVLFITPPSNGNKTYWVRITNPAGSVDSNAAIITAPATIPSALAASGSDTYGQLGNGTPLTNVQSFADIAQRVVHVSAGMNHSLFVTDDGVLWGMGSNSYGQLGLPFLSGHLNLPAPVRIAEDVLQGFAGNRISHFLKRDGSLWGFTSILNQTPAMIATGVVQASSGSGYLLFLKADGTLWQYGHIDGFPPFNAIPTLIDSGVKRCAAGTRHYLYIKTDGTTWGMGENQYGQLGNSTANRFATPVQMKIGSTPLLAIDVAAGDAHSLLLTQTWTYSTGRNASGQLGSGTTSSRSAWNFIPIGAVSAISAGYENSLFLQSNGTLLACGRNDSGQLGSGSNTQLLNPTQVASSVTRMAGGYQHTLIAVGRPLIQSQSLQIGVLTGQTPTLSVSATGFPTLSYRWYRGESGDLSQPISGATAASYVTPPFSGQAIYWVRVTSPAGSINSQTIVVYPLTTPVITSQPAPLTTAAGLTATLTAAASGGELSYRWYYGMPGDTSNPVPGGNSATLDTPALLSTTTFWVRATNALGSADSQAVVVTILPGKMIAWGSNDYGQLGDGTITEHTLPLQIATGGASVIGGNTHTLLLKADGSLWGAGADSFDTLGIPSGHSFPSFTQIDSGVAAVDTGSIYSMYLKTDGTLWCMGNFEWTINDRTYSEVPVQVASGVVKFAAGERHFLYLDAAGTLRGAGANFWGQLGDGSRTDRETPVVIATDVKDVAAGDDYTLFLKQDGNLWGMGSSSSGEIGNDDDETDQGTPVPVTGGVAKIYCGNSHSFFIKTDASLWAMGSNSYGQLGNGNTSSQRTPVQIDTDVALASAGGYHSLYVKNDGTLLAMGRNSGGQLGNGGYENSTTPSVLAQDVVQADADSESSYFVKTDGTVWAAGSNTSGEFGNGVISGHYTPAIIEEDAVAKVAVASSHSFFIKPDGELFAMGRNTSGQLGDGTIQTRFAPVSVATGVSSVSTASSHTLIIKTDGTLWAAGANSSGQLGDGTKISRRTFVPVSSNVTDAVAGGSFSLFLKTDGSLWGMGSSSSGQLGRSNGSYATPVLITDSVRRIAAGSAHTLILKKDGTFWAMGSDSDDQTAGNSPSSSTTPLHQVATGVTDIAASGNHSLYVTANGELWVMGDNSQNQIAPGDSFGPLPQPTKLAEGVSRVWTSGSASLFLKTDGSLWSQGYGNDWNSDSYLGWLQGNRPRKLATGIVSAASSGSHSLFVSVGPLISSPPDGVTIPAGTSATFSVAAIGNGPISYQWYRGPSGDTSQPLAGATAPSYSTPPSSSPAIYWVRVSNGHGHHDSRSALMAIEGLGGSYYQAWTVEKGLEDLAKDADPDHDGLSNWMEHFLNSNPLADEPALRPTGAFVPGSTPAMTITFRRTQLGGYYKVEWSPDLITWSEVSNTFYPHVIGSDVEGDGTTDLLRLTRPVQAGETAGFLRLTVPESD